MKFCTEFETLFSLKKRFVSEKSRKKVSKIKVDFVSGFHLNVDLILTPKHPTSYTLEG